MDTEYRDRREMPSCDEPLYVGICPGVANDHQFRTVYVYMPHEGLVPPPRRLFQTQKSREYVASKPLLMKGIQSWRNSGVECVFHDDLEQDEFMKKGDPELYSLWRRLPIPVMKADIWRYAIIYAYGGIYADVDTALAPNMLDTMLEPCLLLCTAENHIHCCNWVFSAPPKSPVLKYVLDLVVNRLRAHGTIDAGSFQSNPHLIHSLTGPGAFTDGVRAWARSVGIVLPGSVLDWSTNTNCVEHGLVVRPSKHFHEKVVLHRFSGQWPDGWTHARDRLVREGRNARRLVLTLWDNRHLK